MYHRGGHRGVCMHNFWQVLRIVRNVQLREQVRLTGERTGTLRGIFPSHRGGAPRGSWEHRSPPPDWDRAARGARHPKHPRPSPEASPAPGWSAGDSQGHISIPVLGGLTYLDILIRRGHPRSCSGARLGCVWLSRDPFRGLAALESWGATPSPGAGPPPPCLRGIKFFRWL